MNNKIAIVGSDSFIAQKFINRFRNDYSFVSFSRLKTFDYEILKEDFFDIESSELKGCDVLINFAAIVHQPKLNDEKIYERVNYKLPLELAIKAKNAGVKHFIQMSTIAVYGNVENIRDSTPTNPVQFYGKYKLMADEGLLKMIDDNFNICCLRPSMVYGGGNAPGNLTTLLKLIKTGFPLPFKGIINIRNFINVNNLTQVIGAVIERNIGSVLIMSDEEPVSTSEIVSLANKFLGRKDVQFKSRLFLVFLEKIKPSIAFKLTSNLIVKNSIPFNDLGLSRIYSLEEGLKEML